MKKCYLLLACLLLCATIHAKEEPGKGVTFVGKTVKLELHPKIRYAIPNTDLGFIPYLPPADTGPSKAGRMYLLVHVDKDGAARAVHQEGGNYLFHLSGPKDFKTLDIDNSVIQNILKNGVIDQWSHGRVLIPKSELDSLVEKKMIISSEGPFESR